MLRILNPIKINKGNSKETRELYLLESLSQQFKSKISFFLV